MGYFWNGIRKHQSSISMIRCQMFFFFRLRIFMIWDRYRNHWKKTILDKLWKLFSTDNQPRWSNVPREWTQWTFNVLLLDVSLVGISGKSPRRTRDLFGKRIILSHSSTLLSQNYSLWLQKYVGEVERRANDKSHLYRHAFLNEPRNFHRQISRETPVIGTLPLLQNEACIVACTWTHVKPFHN